MPLFSRMSELTSMKRIFILITVFNLVLFNLPSIKQVGNVQGQEISNITQIKWSPDGKFIAIGYQDGKIQVQNATSGAIGLNLDGHTDTIWSLDWKSDNSQLISGSEDGSAIVWDISSG